MANFLYIALGGALGAMSRYAVAGWTHRLLRNDFSWGTLAVNVAGATVVRGIMGYGATSRLHTAKVLRLSMDLPVVIELMDTEEKLQPLMPFLDAVVEEGLITLEPVRVIKYRHSGN